MTVQMKKTKKLLADWAIRKQIPHWALDELLKIQILLKTAIYYLYIYYLIFNSLAKDSIVEYKTKYVAIVENSLGPRRNRMGDYLNSAREHFVSV